VKGFLTTLAIAIFLTGCALEAGRVIELRLSTSLSSRVPIRESLNAVAAELGMIVEGPEIGPGRQVGYRAMYPGKSFTVDFFIYVEVGDRPSIVIRTLNPPTVDPSLAERAFELFRTELDHRGLKYQVRRN